MDDCYYSIDVTTAANRELNSLEKGHFKDISLDKDQTMLFVYENLEKEEEIKILALHVSG